MVKLNIDDNLDITRRFDVMSIPTLILFKDGEPADAHRGGQGQGPAAPGALGAPLSARWPAAGRVAGAAEPAVSGREPDREIHLELGDEGEAVADVQRRLADLGLSPGVDPEGDFRDGTRAAVEAFQYRRGLRVDGVCGRQTWSALVEAGRRLGDRFLYRRSPMLRGDDVAELQQRLSALGFDTGRVDGIFGDLTSAALGEFQRNAGLPVDGIAGAATVAELLRFGSRHDGSELVSAVRDRERLRQAPRTLAGPPGVHRRGGRPRSHRRGGPAPPGQPGGPGDHPPPSRRVDPGLRGQRRRGRGLRRAPAGATEPGCSTSYYARLPLLLPRRAPPGRAPPRGPGHRRSGCPDGGSRGHVPPRPARDPDAGGDLRDRPRPSVVVERAPVIARAVVDSLAEWVDTAWD